MKSFLALSAGTALALTGFLAPGLLLLAVGLVAVVSEVRGDKDEE